MRIKVAPLKFSPMVKTNKPPKAKWSLCAKCLKPMVPGKEKTLEIIDGKFVPVQNVKGDVWQFGPNCFKAILENNLTPEQVRKG